MATLKKSDLNVVLKTEANKKSIENAKFADTAIKSAEEKFGKTTTKIGLKDGEVLGGIKSIGEVNISPNEVLKDGVGQLTDKIPGIDGLATPSSSLSSLMGLPAMVQSGGDVKSSAMAAVGGGAPEDIQSAVDKVTTISGESMTDISTFTATIASAGELTSITAALPDLKIPSINDVVGEITPVASLSSVGDAVKDTVSNATGIGGLTASVTEPKNALSKFGSIGALGKKVFDDVKSTVTELKDDINSFVTSFDARTDRGLGGVLQDIGEGLTGSANAFIQNLVPGGISATESERKRILEQFNSGDVSEKTKATKTLVTKSPNVSARMKSQFENTEAETTLELSDKVKDSAKKEGIPDAEINTAIKELENIDTQMSKLNTTIGGTVVIDAELFDAGLPVDANNTKWDGRNSKDDVFTYVSSVEELDAEFNKIKRQITEVVVHATETTSNKDIGAIEINNIHNELGHDGIGYHYVIRRDGRLQRGRPVNKQGEHAPTNNHDLYSIGLVLVGGLNISSGAKNVTDYASSQSFTLEQFITLEKFIRSFYRKYSGGQVFGHNNIDLNEEDPYFDVDDYIDSRFRKKNSVKDPANKEPLSPAEINIQ